MRGSYLSTRSNGKTLKCSEQGGGMITCHESSMMPASWTESMSSGYYQDLVVVSEHLV